MVREMRWLALFAALLAGTAHADNITFMGVGGGLPGPTVATITFPVFAAGNNASFPSNSAANFESFVSGGIGSSIWASATNQHSIPISVAGTVKNLRVVDVTTGTGVTTGTYVFTLYQNTVATALTCTIPTGNPNNCLDDTHSVTVAQGDVLEWQINPATTPTASQNFSISAVVQSSSLSSSLFSGNLSATLSATTFIGFGHNQPPSATEAAVSSLLSVAGTIDQMCIYAANGSGTTTGWTAQLRHNEAAATGGLTVSLTNQQKNCVSTGSAESFAAGDRVGVQLVCSTCTASMYIYVSARWTPSSPGYQPVFMNAGAVTTSTRTGPMAGGMGAGDGADNEANIFPTTATGWSVGNLRTTLNADPGSGNNRSFTLQTATSIPANFPATYTSRSPSCSITGGSGASCSDANLWTAGSGELADIKFVCTLGTCPTLTWGKIGMSVKQQ